MSERDFSRDEDSSSERSESKRAASFEQRALGVLRRDRDRALERLETLEAQVTLLGSWVDEALARGAELLGSRRWKVGDLIVNGLAKRLLRRPNLRAPWAPDVVQEVARVFRAWDADRKERPANGGLSPGSVGNGPPASALAEVESELARLLGQIEAARSNLSLLISWLDRLTEACADIVGSQRWRVGNGLTSRIYRFLPLVRSAAPLQALEDVARLRKVARAWKGDEGKKLLGSDRSRADRSPALGPPGLRPRIQTWRKKVEYRSFAESAAGVSIVVLNRDGRDHLHNLFASFLDTNTHPEVEFVVVDHASSDGSRSVIEQFGGELPIRELRYEVNNSFAFGNNRGAEAATGTYLFFLNNDIIFSRDVIAEFIERAQRAGTGVVGAGLRYPDYYETSPGGLQHGGIRFRPDSQFCFFRPFNLTRLDESVTTDSPSPAVTAAALFCLRHDFFEVGGFDEGYVYGYEDVDLCLEFMSRKKLASVVAHDLELTHDESATQRTQTGDELRTRRLANIERLSRRFGYPIKRAFWADLVRGEKFWADRGLRMGFAVEEQGLLARAGDFFTASELGRACHRRFGWQVRYQARKDVSRDWYDVADLDVLLVMLDTYDLTMVRNEDPGLVKVAWMRNWFDRWAQRPWFGDFDLYLCSSERAARYIRDQHGKHAEVLRIATDAERFRPSEPDPDFASDYCFTGSYWNSARDLEKLRPNRIDANFGLFGNGWEDHRRFRRHRRGFVAYPEIHKVYQSTKIVIDDANHATKPWGSINSRVFDALASGALVITNGPEGAREVFGGLLPTYETAGELEGLVERYLADASARKQLGEKLRAEVLAKHTYAHRAAELSDILSRFVRERFRIALKVPCPSEEQKHQWGDYHMALALERELEKLGHSTRIDLLPEWDHPRGIGDDIVLVFRGLSRYQPRPMHINLLWNISHPDQVSDEEYELYDHVFVASSSHAEELGDRLRVRVSELLQCTDPDLFHPDAGSSSGRNVLNVLFVGNSRKQARPIVRDAIEAGLPLTVFGAMWDGLIPAAYVAGEHIPNRELHGHYSRAGVLLNDHWPSMRERGFVSNRLFDAGASAACVVSDEAIGLEELFGDCVVSYDGTASDLRIKVEALLSNPIRRHDMGHRLRELVLSKHTFAHRTEVILAEASKLHDVRMRGLGSGEPPRVLSESRRAAAKVERRDRA